MRSHSAGRHEGLRCHCEGAVNLLIHAQRRSNTRATTFKTNLAASCKLTTHPHPVPWVYFSGVG